MEKDKTCGNVRIVICPTKMCCGKEKKYKEKTMKQIINTVNAMLNASGGRLEMTYERTPPKKHVDDIVRAIEQKLHDLIGITTMVSKVVNKVAEQKIVIVVMPIDSLSTIKYNLYLPTKSQVICVPPAEPIEEIRKIIGGISPPGVGTSLVSYHQDFVLNQRAKLDEDVNVQCKSLKSKASKCVTFADRMMNNKFSDYISAFANHLGGHIYYGVNDHGIVEGEYLTDKDRKEIIKKAHKALDKMIWPEHSKKLEKGLHWDIFFEPVKDFPNGSPIPNTYVVIVGVIRCPGGVFTEEPESYFLNGDDNVEKMGFDAWKRKLLPNNDSLEQATGKQQVIHRKGGSSTVLPLVHPSATTSALHDIPSHVHKYSWSSRMNHKIYNWFTAKLLECRNNKDMEKFEKIVKTAAEYPESDANLVALAERVAVEYKRNNLVEAERLLNQFARVSLTASVKDGHMLYVRGLYLRSRIERAKGTGHYEDSYWLAIDGLQQLQLLPAEFITPWFYMHASSVATMRPCGANFREALNYLEMAKKSAYGLECYPEDRSDLLQKLCIYTAEALLGCSLYGLESKYVSHEALEKAEEELKKVYQLPLNGTKLTHFRKIQYNVALSDLEHRRADNCIEGDREELLQSSLTFCKKAYNLACEHQFGEMIIYSSIRSKALSEKLSVVMSDTSLENNSDILNDLNNFIKS